MSTMELRERRKQLRLCTDCGKPARHGLTTCQACGEKRLAATNALLDRRKSEGVCVRCGEPTRPGLRTCQKCGDSYNEWHRAKYAQLINDGLCVHCGKPARADRTTCQECADKSAEYRRNRAVQLKNEGKCVQCGKAALLGLTKCQECKDKNREASRERYEFCKEHGVCARCGKESAEVGAFCAKCVEKRSVAQRHPTDGQKAEWSKRAKQRYEQRKADGLCTNCGKHPAVPGNVECIRCKSRHAQWRDEHRDSTAGIEGICRTKGCSSPVVEGKKYCVECLPAKQEAARYARQSIDTKNLPFARSAQTQIALIRARAAGKSGSTT